MTSCYELVIHHSRWLFLPTVTPSRQTKKGATHVNQKWVCFPVNMPLCYQICVAKCPYSDRDDPLETMARRRRPSSLLFRGEVGAAVHNSFSEISHYHQCTECYACSKCHVTLLTLTLSMQLSLHVRESKTILDSGFHSVDSRFQVLDPSLCQWNLESGFQLFVGFRIHLAVFRIPKPRIADSQA